MHLALFSAALTVLATYVSAQAAAQQGVSIYTLVPGLNAPTATSTFIPVITNGINGNSAYSQKYLTPPGIAPEDLQKENRITLNADGGMPGLSIPHKGNLLGLSIELSVANKLLGVNSSYLFPTFLNYMANIKERAGAGPVIRIGGNSQEESVMYPDTIVDEAGKLQMVHKYQIDNNNPTFTPNVNFARELIYAMGNVSSLVGADWYFGLAFMNPYNDSNAMEVAKLCEDQLGDHLLALQVANEPDLYAKDARRRPLEWTMNDYFNEFGKVLGDLNTIGLKRDKIVMGPSVCCEWSTKQVLDQNYIGRFSQDLGVVSAMHYPDNNCGISGVADPQERFANYLTHRSAQIFIENYLDAAPLVVAAGLPFVMLETNTASCGGFPGISDSFGATLWGIDNALSLAATNFTHVLLHVGGQGTSYNPFTPPLTNISKDHGWTTGSIYYSMLAVAETLGSSNVSQIVDLHLPSDYQPGYAIYENGKPARVALINYATDPSGASDYNAIISFNGGTVPSQVYVRHMSAPSTAEKFAITWAGQTMGSTYFASDGRLKNNVTTETIPCDAATNTCTITVKAPSFALVFLSEEALNGSSGGPAPSPTMTFATTAYTNARQVPMIDPAVLKTMNGHGGPGPRRTGSTAKGQGNNVLHGSSASTTFQMSVVGTVFALICGVMFALR